jgi:hypothetical protein
MLSWRNDEKKMVVEALSENADGCKGTVLTGPATPAHF